MSHYRRLSGGKRDSNELAIRKRFAHHGWHTEQLSGTAIPDLLCWPPSGRGGWRVALLVDVKEPTGKPTPAQAEKWKALSANGIPVYVARTEADVDAIVAGSADPWGVMEAKSAQRRLAPGSGESGGTKRGCASRASYTPPERHPDDAAFTAEVMRRIGLRAAQEAEATFAPAPDAPDMTDTLGPGPHPEHYDCPCAPCVERWNP